MPVERTERPIEAIFLGPLKKNKPHRHQLQPIAYLHAMGFLFLGSRHYRNPTVPESSPLKNSPSKELNVSTSAYPTTPSKKSSLRASPCVSAAHLHAALALRAGRRGRRQPSAGLPVVCCCYPIQLLTNPRQSYRILTNTHHLLPK